MRKELKTAPADVAMTLADVKEYAFFNTTKHDSKISALIQPATEYVEKILGRKLINQSWYLYLDVDEYFDRLDAYNNSIELSTLNVSAITEVNKYDIENTATVITSSDYRLSGGVLSNSCRMVFNESASPKSISVRSIDSIRIEVVAGYGADQDAVPTSIQTALKMLISHWVNFNHSASKEKLYNTPAGFEQILSPYKSAGVMFG